MPVSEKGNGAPKSRARTRPGTTVEASFRGTRPWCAPSHNAKAPESPCFSCLSIVDRWPMKIPLQGVVSTPRFHQGTRVF
jgi:hypothetical protein